MRQKDTTLLQDLIRKYARMYMKMAYEYGVRYDDTEDVVMESFMAYYQSDNYEKLDEGNAKNVLARIVFNKSIDYHRKNRRSLELMVENGEEMMYAATAHPSTEPERNLILQENNRRTRQIFESMKPVWRDAATMYFLEGMTYAEISKALEVSETVCRKRVSRARDYLRKELSVVWNISYQNTR